MNLLLEDELLSEGDSTFLLLKLKAANLSSSLLSLDDELELSVKQITESMNSSSTFNVSVSKYNL